MYRNISTDYPLPLFTRLQLTNCTLYTLCKAQSDITHIPEEQFQESMCNRKSAHNRIIMNTAFHRDKMYKNLTRSIKIFMFLYYTSTISTYNNIIQRIHRINYKYMHE